MNALSSSSQKFVLQFCTVSATRNLTGLDGGTYRLQNSYVYYKLESKATSNFFLTSKKLGRLEKNMTFKFFSSRRPAKIG